MKNLNLQIKRGGTFYLFFKLLEIDADETLKRHILPVPMHTNELKELLNNYYQAHEKIKDVIADVNTKLKMPDGKHLSLEELDEFFQDNNNVSQYPEIANNFKKLREDLFTSNVKPFDEYCMAESTYETYITEYYGNRCWFAFQRSFENEKNSSMIDIAACYLKKQIVILQKNAEGELEEIHRTQNQAVDQIFIEYNGHDHFIKIEKPEEDLKFNDENKSQPAP